MKLCRTVSERIVLHFAFLLGLQYGGLGAFVQLEEAKIAELSEYVSSANFLRQFARNQRLDSEVLQSGFKVSVQACLGIDEVGYPQYAVACEISLAQQQISYNHTATSKNTAIVFIAEHEVLKESNETLKTSSQRGRPFMSGLSGIFGKFNKSEQRKTTEGSSKAKGKGKYNQLNSGDDTSLKKQGSSSSNGETVKINPSMQKRIFAVPHMVWDSVFKIGLLFASAITDKQLFGPEVSKEVPSNTIRDFDVWLKSGMKSSEECPENVLNAVKEEIGFRKQNIIFSFLPINYFVCRNTKSNKPKLHIITLEARTGNETYQIGAALLGFEEKKTAAFIVHGRIFLTNFFKEKVQSIEESNLTLEDHAKRFQMPFVDWSLKQNSVPVYSGRAIGIFKKRTNIFDSPCVTYAVVTTENSCDTCNLMGYMELRDKIFTRQIKQTKSEGAEQRTEEVFADIENFSNRFPNWVTKIQPLHASNAELINELERIKNDYATELGKFRRKDSKLLSFEWEYLTEAEILVADPLGNTAVKIVVHALHVYNKQTYCDTKYSLAIVSNTGSVVIGLQTDPAPWYVREIDEWQTILSKPALPFKVQVVWWMHYPKKSVPKDFMNTKVVQKAIKGTHFAEFYAIINPSNGDKKDVRECYGYHMNVVTKVQDVFVIYHFGLGYGNPTKEHYRVLQLTFEVTHVYHKSYNVGVSEATPKVVTTNLEAAENEYDTSELAKSAVEAMLQQSS